MRWLDGITNSMDMSLSKLRQKRSLVCCSARGHKESKMTEQLNWTEFQCVDGFSHTIKQFSDSSRVPYNSAQFWHFLPGDGIWFHRLKFQSYKTVPPHTHIHTSDAYQFSSVHFSSLSCVWLFVTPCPVAHQASLFITKSWSLLKLMSIELVMPSNHLILCCPLLLLLSIFPSIRLFSNESALPIRWSKYWSFSFSISLSNEYSGLTFFRMDWLDLLAVQGTHKSLLQHHRSEVSVL